MHVSAHSLGKCYKAPAMLWAIKVKETRKCHNQPQTQGRETNLDRQKNSKQMKQYISGQILEIQKQVKEDLTFSKGCPAMSAGDGALAIKIARDTTRKDNPIHQKQK